MRAVLRCRCFKMGKCMTIKNRAQVPIWRIIYSFDNAREGLGNFVDSLEFEGERSTMHNVVKQVPW